MVRMCLRPSLILHTRRKGREGGREIKSNLLLQLCLIIIQATLSSLQLQIAGGLITQDGMASGVCGKQLPERLSPAPRKTSYQACKFHGFSGSVNIIGMFNLLLSV